MTTQALYNKWRGQTFDDILGQEHITKTLRNQIGAGRISHAYLFVGLRGTGKTSTARIMAKAVNCVGETVDPPCNQCHICQSITQGRSLDLIEIDAASNRGIDEIRALRDGVVFLPHECRYKVYVIDEVHMLTNEAFNALLKTLEEPPSHVIFILCTTAPHRLPDTILSRCQRFDFRRGSVAAILKKLHRICEQERITIVPDALDLIARRADGSFRDAESLLDQLAAYGSIEITLDLVQNVLGSVSSALVSRLVESLIVGDIPTGLRAINQAIDEGGEPRQFLSEILEHLRALLLLKVGGEENLNHLGTASLSEMRRLIAEQSFALGLLIRAIRLFNGAGQGLRNASRPQLPLELAFIETILHAEGTPPVTNAKQQPAIPIKGGSRVAKSAPDVAVESEETTPTEETVAAAPAAPLSAKPTLKERDSAYDGTPSASQELSLEQVQSNWDLILAKLKSRSHQVQALLNSAHPISVEGDKITLGCEASFHRDTLSETKRLGLVEQVLSQVLGLPCRVECVVGPAQRNTPQNSPQSPNPSTRQSSQKDPESRELNLREKLLNHPVVKRLEQRGGHVSKIALTNQDEIGG